MLKKTLTICNFLFLVAATLVSLKHLLGGLDTFHVSTLIVGLLGWVSLFCAITLASFSFIRHSIIVWSIFFCLGLFTGPFLEPPSDPLHHLEEIQGKHGEGIENIDKVNRGLWHYSMLSIIVHVYEAEDDNAQIYLDHIQVAHAVVFACLLTVIFVTGKKVGLRSRWAFFSSLVALLFMGTGRFSYFSYYSFAPSSSSLLLLWLWSALFFMKKAWSDLMVGAGIALLLLPILVTNHIQEAVFLLYLVVVWFLLNLFLCSFKSPAVEEKSSQSTPAICKYFMWSRKSKIIVASILFFVFFILPQLDLYTNLASTLYADNYNLAGSEISLWEKNRELVLNWSGFHFGGKVWSYRVQDTFTGMGIIMGCMGLLFFSPLCFRKNKENKIKVYVLAMMPFIIIFTPLLHFFWVSNVGLSVYYRICYISMFWLFWGELFQSLEGWFYLVYKNSISWVRGAQEK